MQKEDLPGIQPPKYLIREAAPRWRPVPYRPETPSRKLSSARADASQTVPGFRVQLFSGTDPSYARQLLGIVEENFGMAAYLVFEAPQYKVRVGDFTSRPDAVEACDRLRTAGYRDAWIVQSPVMANPAPR